MDAYATEVERVMKRLFDSLAEKDRRRYAAVEATKLGHGGVGAPRDSPGAQMVSVHFFASGTCSSRLGH